jgi:anti-sigma28 factor (negative regulator of flagellin synthesis)
MQLSESEIHKTFDLLRKKQTMCREGEAVVFSAEEIDRIKQIVTQLSEAPSIRLDRVEKVRRAFENSDYHVTSDDVAKEMIGRTITDKLT